MPVSVVSHIGCQSVGGKSTYSLYLMTSQPVMPVFKLTTSNLVSERSQNQQALRTNECLVLFDDMTTSGNGTMISRPVVCHSPNWCRDQDLFNLSVKEY